MHRHHTFTLSVIAALLSACATTPPLSSSNRPSSPSVSMPAASPPVVNAQAVGDQFLPPMVVAANAPYLVDLTAHADDLWDRIRVGFAIPNMDSPLVVEQQAWFLSHPEFLQRAVDRSSHYLYHVVEELEKRHMPTELALLPFIESAYNPMAYSRAHASGMWQFIPSTGKNFNLKQDWWHDDRRDVIASTDAALNYLGMLYEMHGDWTLALASYNWGEGAVKRAIDKNLANGRPTDYLSLNMPEETRTYYPRLQALKNIIANPAAFGLSLPHIDNQPYFVTVSTTRDMDVRTAAELADMPLEDFRALNPSFNRPIISAASNTALLLPADRAAAFQDRLDHRQAPLLNWQAYRVHRGERIDRIAARFGMSVAALCEANSLNPKERLKPGVELLVSMHHAQELAAAPAAHSPDVRSADAPENAMLPARAGIIRASYRPASGSASPALYTVRRGDTLFSIAQRFHLSIDELKRSNHLHSSALASGETLRVTAAP